ncbi:hypothetical protein SLEP1_g34874 [Rubroshorea leprosula]|uniref:Membrane protein of ER body-like protein n=1 Tax=Rubroshorea leprosula TaxID=152421 RepID=A0AAV5KLF6_9ROSI|nr:hypothetical protein SLEP1_g34874 [Rubroshorea leprosula]
MEVEVEEVEVEDNVALRRRQYRKPDLDANPVGSNGSKPGDDHGGIESEASAVTNGSEPAADLGGIESEASAEQEGEEEVDDRERDVEHENGNGGGDNLEENGGGGGIRSGVYFDKLEGSLSSFELYVIHTMNLGTESTNVVSEIQSERIHIAGSSNCCGKIVESVNVSGLRSSPPEKSFDTPEAGSKHFDQRTDVDVDVDVDEDFDSIEEIEEEFTELDVEGVLKMQNTHDLYCPNCNSCITRRVILIRRKPKIRHKRKPERKFDDHPTYAPDAQGSENVSSTTSATPALDEQGNDGEREAFRCLSCLSFFIPTGNGFRIFKFSGESKKNENTPSPENIPAGRTNWFFSIFAIGKSKTALEQARSLPEVGAIDQHVPSQSADNMSHSHKNDPLGDPIDSRTATHPGKPADPPLAPIAMEPKVDVETVNETVSDHNDSTQTESFVYGGQVRDGVTGPQKSVKDISNSSTEVSILMDMGGKSDDAMVEKNPGDDLIVVVEEGSVGTTVSQRIESTAVSTENGVSESRGLDILKSIVYGGLIESITSLGVVSSAAGAGASTLNVLALGLANLLGGLFVIIHNLRELKNEQSGGVSSETNTQEDRYQEILGRRDNFALHATVSILSYLIFGLVPPVVYSFSFRQSDNRDLKLASLAAASLVCIILLAIGKAHVGKPRRTYFKTVLHYVIIGFMASGVSYLVGELLKKLLEELGWFDSSSAVTTLFPEAKPLERAWASY